MAIRPSKGTLLSKLTSSLRSHNSLPRALKDPASPPPPPSPAKALCISSVGPLAMNPFLLFPLLLLLSSSSLNLSSAQISSNSPPPPSPSPTPPPPFASTYASCSDGVGVVYSFQSLTRSFPNETNAADQPYAFTANLQIFNAGDEDLSGWEVFIGYVNKEILVSASGAAVADGSQFPVNASQGVTLTSPTILKTGIETALDYTQMGVTLVLTGTEFGHSNVSMPNNISLTNPGYSCSTPTTTSTSIETCCHPVANSALTVTATSFLPRYEGDITISYDVTQAYTNNYWAQVTISNDSPTASVNFWNLQWTWQNGEYIQAMKGAETTEQDQNACISGAAGTAYPDTDFSQVMSCQSRPTIIDLDQYKANDSTVGKIEYCCRNGSLLSPVQDPSKSKSVFQLQVYKLPPQQSNQQQNRTLISPPTNWNFSGWFGAAYTCDSLPRLVEPTEFPDPASSLRSESAVMSWQVTCNMTKLQQNSPRKCCVSFSSYNNDSVVPCRTCACGCQSQQTCDSSAEALLIPTELATVPFVNRTEKTLAWAQLNHLPVPQKLPCPDNCGVSINWHFLSEFTDGWSARMTIFNWQGIQFADWSAAVELGRTFPGFQSAYSFNFSTPGNSTNNDTILMYGLSGLNYLNGIYDNYPGIQQSVLAFTMQGVDNVSAVTARDYFPTKVFFDGNECALPDVLPSGGTGLLSPRLWVFLSLPLLLLGFGPFGLM